MGWKIRLFTVIFWLPWYQLSAQVADSTRGKYAVSASYQYGFIAAHRPIMRHLQTGHVKGIEAAVMFSTQGKKDWHRLHNFPEWGFYLDYFDLANPEILGKAITITPCISFPVIKKKSFEFNITAGWGLGFVEKPFHRYENFKNVAIGSRLNATNIFRFRIQQKIVGRTWFNLQLGLTHFSNAAYAMPNLGINIASLDAGLKSYFGIKEKYSMVPLKNRERKFVHAAFAAGSIKEFYPADGPKFGVASAGFETSKIISNKSAVGAGLDFYYDDSLYRELRQKGKSDSGTWSAFRAGIHIGYEFTLSRLSMTIQNGFYLYTKVKEDGIQYHRLGIRYKLNEKYFIFLNLKTHFARADFHELGFGYKF